MDKKIENIKYAYKETTSNLAKNTELLEKNLCRGLEKMTEYANDITRLMDIKHDVGKLYKEIQEEIDKYNATNKSILQKINKYRRVDDTVCDNRLGLENVYINTSGGRMIDSGKDLCIMAKKVKTWEDAELGENGLVYYIQASDQFALKINNHLLHGNIGTIFSNNSNPTKIKTCKFNKNCIKNACTYYHDPKDNPGSTDTRNYMASSWFYSSNSLDKKIRRFGSRYRISEDIRRLSHEEYERFKSQTMHEILCSLILLQNYQHNTL